MQTLELAGRPIGLGHPAYIIAEAGVNHDGSVDTAHQLVDVAAGGGADAVKFQTFDPAMLASAQAGTAGYQQETTGHSTQREMLASLVLPRAAWRELRDHAHERGIQFLSTPFDAHSAELLVSLGVPAIKVPSGELTNTPLIRQLALLGRPLLLSTGMSALAEVSDAIAASEEAPSIAIFHCVSQYPTPTSQANLRAISTLSGNFNVPIGWSDHTVGTLTAVAATALHASLFEKHITLDKDRPGPDHSASEDPQGFAAYVRAIRATEEALGDGTKQPQPCELANREVARRSWHAARDIPAGAVLSPEDIIALRPGKGIPPAVPIIGRRASRFLMAGTPIQPSMIDP